METHRTPPNVSRHGRQRGESAPATTGGRALAACRDRLHSAVTLLAGANIALRGTVEARDRVLGELREAERAQDAFVIAAVHELKTPLTAVKGRAQLLRMRCGRGAGVTMDQVRSDLLEIESAANTLAAALDDLIDEVERPLPVMTVTDDRMSDPVKRPGTS